MKLRALAVQLGLGHVPPIGEASWIGEAVTEHWRDEVRRNGHK
jgi:hypothetical protein